MIQFKRETCGDVDAALQREWLETNGLGSFASSTIIGLNTRSYHGLLVAATKPPVGRLVLLSKLEETLLIDGRRFDLSANHYPGVIHPQGFHYLKQFRLDPFPVFTYEVEGIEFEKSVFMIHGENSTVIHYELRKNNRPDVPKHLRLEIRPLIAFRDYHGTTHENGVINPAVEERSGLASVTPYYGLPSLHLAHNAIELQDTGDWHRNFEYDAERERGLASSRICRGIPLSRLCAVHTGASHWLLAGCGRLVPHFRCHASVKPRRESGRSVGGLSVRDFCLSDSASNGHSMVRDRFSCGW
jgi:hypothetical protein